MEKECRFSDHFSALDSWVPGSFQPFGRTLGFIIDRYMYALAWACCAGMTWRVTCTDIHVDIDRAPSAQIFSLPRTSMGWCWLVLSRLVPISGREQVDPNPDASPLSHVVVSLVVRLGRRDLQQRVWGKNMEVLLALHSIPLPKSQQIYRSGHSPSKCFFTASLPFL